MSPTNSIFDLNRYNAQNNYVIEDKENLIQKLIGDTLVSLGENMAMLRFEQAQLKKERRDLEEEVKQLKVVHLKEWEFVLSQARANLFSICDRMRTIHVRLMAIREQAKQQSASELAKDKKGTATTSIDAHIWMQWPKNLSQITYEYKYVEYQPTEDKPTPKLTLKFLPAQVQSSVEKMARTHWENYVKLELETAIMRSENQFLAENKVAMIKYHVDKVRVFKRSVACLHYTKIIEELTAYRNQLNSCNPFLGDSYYDEKKNYPEKVIVLEHLVNLVYFIKQRKEEFSA